MSQSQSQSSNPETQSGLCPFWGAFQLTSGPVALAASCQGSCSAPWSQTSRHAHTCKLKGPCTGRPAVSPASAPQAWYTNHHDCSSVLTCAMLWLLRELEGASQTLHHHAAVVELVRSDSSNKCASIAAAMQGYSKVQVRVLCCPQPPHDGTCNNRSLHITHASP